MSPKPLVRIGLAPAERRKRALELVFADLPAEARNAQVDDLIHAERLGRVSLDGLWEARRDGRLVGATWTQVQAGGAAGVWPPRLVTQEPFETADRLLIRALEGLAKRHIRMAQTLLAVDTGPDAERLLNAGFEHLTDLLYLVSPSRDFPATRPTSDLEFETYTDESEPRMASIVEATYAETLDCPRLNGLRPAQDVLVEYRGTGSFEPQRWHFVRHLGQDVGCLLLAAPPTALQWELVYMGLVPGARGHGHGTGMVRYAQWLAGQANAERLTLAVDAANHPAIQAYAAAGFVAWDRRSAFLKFFSAEAAAARHDH